MKPFQRTLVGLAVAAALSTGAAQAQISDNVIKIGVLSDMSSLYTTSRAPGRSRPPGWPSRIPGIEKRGYKVEIISPITRTSRTSARRSRASGTTPTRST
jgi:hypothetical protein